MTSQYSAARHSRIRSGPRRGLSAEPQSMYVDRAARCPVVHTADKEATLLRMGDILYVNKHRGVMQLADLLGSNRPAIPLSLDGPEHTKYRRLLDPVFSDAAHRAARRERPGAGRRSDRRLHRPRRGRRLPGLVRAAARHHLHLDPRAPTRRSAELLAVQEHGARQRVRVPPVRTRRWRAGTKLSNGSSSTSTTISTSGWPAPIRATTCSDGSCRPRSKASASPVRTSSTSSDCS